MTRRSLEIVALALLALPLATESQASADSITVLRVALEHADLTDSDSVTLNLERGSDPAVQYELLLKRSATALGLPTGRR